MSIATSVTSGGTDLVFDRSNKVSFTSTINQSNHTSASTIPEKDPLEDIPTDRTPIKKLIKKLNANDPSLTVLKLDGRKQIKEEDWESLFESLEDNASLTHLSCSRCEISDGVSVPLVLALVENETLQALRLNNNKGLTDDTAKGFLKVLDQSNKTLKKLEMARTKVTKKSIQKLNEALEDRDEAKNAAKMQEERQRKIKALLSFSAGDKVADDIATKVNDDNEGGEDGGDDDGDNTIGSRSLLSGKVSMTSKTNSKMSSKRKTKRHDSEALSVAGNRSKNSRASRASSNTRGGASSSTRGGRGMGAKGRSVRPGRGGMNRMASVRASMTASAMAQMGGDIGQDLKKLKEHRKLRGECESCGQKCYQKSMFKTTPLTIANAVYEGRCLKCNPM